MSIVFYDTETTGTGKFYDQILQFAAIRTDADLNESDRFEIRCRLLPHVVPAPGAMRVTGVRASQLSDLSFPSHYEMVRAIRAKLLSWSPALFIGWNSLEFDEDLVRMALYKTLHNPYLTNRDGNSRSDAMRMAQACSLFLPNALTIPVDGEGKMVFKLDHIAPANGFAHSHVHDAMGDVEATIFLCRHLIERAPEIWSSFMRFSTKAAVVDYINDEVMFCLSEFYFSKPYSHLVTTIGQNQKNMAEWYVYDLSVDPESLRPLSEAQLAARLNRSPKPLRRLKSNGAPMLCSGEEAPGICHGRECGFAELNRRAESLRVETAFRMRLISAFESIKKEYPASPHVEQQIYDGFFEKSDERLMDAFHLAEWSERYAIVERFQDSRLRTIGRQLIHLERHDLLDEAVRREYDLAVAQRILGRNSETPWLTLPEAIGELEKMLAAAIGAELVLLREHNQYLRERYERALAHMQ
jgi:exodeoxyribonuclease I